MPRVNGGSPGSPGSAPFMSKIGGSVAPYVVSNFARPRTRLVASAYLVRSQSARLRLFFGTVGWYAGVCAGRLEGLQHPQIGEVVAELLVGEVEAQRSAVHPGRERGSV